VGAELMTNEQKVTWLASFSHFITHGYMTLLPAVLVVIAGEHSMSFQDIGIIAGIGYFLYGLGAFPSGYLADKFGSKRILTVGVFGMAISSILVGLSQGVAGFAITYGLLGIFASIHHPAGLSLITRRVSTSRGKALGFHGVFGNIGLFMTPMAAALSLMVFHTWRAAYLVFGVIGIGFGIILYMTRLDQEPDLSLKDVFGWPNKLLGNRKSEVEKEVQDSGSVEEPGGVGEIAMSVIPVALLVLFLGSILSGFIFRGSLTFFPSLLQREIYFITSHDEPVVIAGFVTTAILSLGLIGSWFGGYLNDKIKVPELFPVAIFIIVAPALYGISRFTDSRLLATGCLFSLVYYAWQPSHNYLIAKYTKKASQGIGFGVNFFLIFGMGSIATAIGGYVSDDYGVDRFYWIMAIIAVCAMLVAISVLVVRRYQIRFNWKVVKEDEVKG
jgi:sugar phosphate permease